MDRQEYLNQISAANRPVKKSHSGIFSSKFFLAGIIGIVVFALILVVGAIISGSRADSKTEIFSLSLHLDNTLEVIEKYQNEIKSSALRSYSASLYSVISSTNSDLNKYISENYDAKANNLSEKVTEEENLTKDALMEEFFNAKINGMLDSIYAQKMTYEISVIIARETKIINSANNENLKSLLATSSNSLTVLYDNFNNFSETK